MAIELEGKVLRENKLVFGEQEGELTPQQIVAELDKYIIGQKAAKKAVAIALRNRFRRRKLPPELGDESPAVNRS